MSQCRVVMLTVVLVLACCHAMPTSKDKCGMGAELQGPSLKTPFSLLQSKQDLVSGKSARRARTVEADGPGEAPSEPLGRRRAGALLQLLQKVPVPQWLRLPAPLGRLPAVLQVSSLSPLARLPAVLQVRQDPAGPPSDVTGLRAAVLGGPEPLSPTTSEQESVGHGFWMKVVGSLVYLLLVLCVAYIYVQHGYRTEALEAGSPTKPPGIEELPADNFRFGIWDCDGCCGRDCKICLCGWCCLGIRWADTLSQNKLKLGVGFWSMVFFHAACTCLDEITLGLSMIAFLIFAIYFRQRLRAAFGLKRGTCGTYCQDCLVWTFCCPCAAVQEAREVEFLPLPAVA